MQIRGFFEKLSHYVNRNELVFDAAITLAAVGVYRAIVPESGFEYNARNLPVLLAIIVCIQFFTSLYFASLLKKQDEMAKAVTEGTWPPPGVGTGPVERFNKRMIMSKAVRFTLYGAVFLAITGLCILLPLKFQGAVFNSVSLLDGHPYQFVDMFGWFLSSSVICLAGVMLFKDDYAYNRWWVMMVFPLIYFVPGFPLSIVFFANNGGWLGALLFVLATAAVFAGVIFLKRHFRDRNLSDIRFFAKLVIILRSFIVPFCTAIALIIWNEMSLASAIHDLVLEGLAPSALNVFLIMLGFGLIPFRLIVLVSPPVKPLHLFTATASLVLYFISLNSMIAKIA